MTADAYLPVVFKNIPASCFFEDSGRPRRNVEHHLRSGVLRLIAGPHECHAIVDIRRPYSRPPRGHRGHAMTRSLPPRLPPAPSRFTGAAPAPAASAAGGFLREDGEMLKGDDLDDEMERRWLKGRRERIATAAMAGMLVGMDDWRKRQLEEA